MTNLEIIAMRKEGKVLREITERCIAHGRSISEESVRTICKEVPKPTKKIIICCKHCNKEFRNYVGKLYCGTACFYLSQHKPKIYVELVCPVCHKHFKQAKRQYDLSKGNFCSNKCRGIVKRTPDSPNSCYGFQKLKCINCGESFVRHNNAVSSGTGKFCCRECYFIFSETPDSPYTTCLIHILTCDQCGIKFDRTQAAKTIAEERGCIHTFCTVSCFINYTKGVISRRK